jgi:hypothetical protein
MNTLESRKQLLIAESELNRAQMVGAVASLTAGARALAHRATSLGSIGSSAAVLALGLTALQRDPPVVADAKANSSRLHGILKGVVLVSALWLVFSAQSRDRSRA